MFNDDWELMFFFFENHLKKAQCYICLRQLAKCDKYNIRRHYHLCHIDYEKYKNCERQTKLDELKAKVPQKFLKQPDDIDRSDERPKLKASYVVALALAKQCRPYQDGIFVKNLLQEVLTCFGPNFEELALSVEKIPLSARTINRRTTKISSFLFMVVQKRLQECLFFSIRLDESTDISNTSQLIIYVKTVHENLVTHEDFLGLVPMPEHVNGEILWETFKEKVFSIADQNKLSAVCTDGTNMLVGKKKGFIEYLMQYFDVPSFHCIRHQQALFAKNVCLNEVMKICIQMINKIRELNNRRFKTFIEEVEADYGDLLLLTEVKWLSRGRSLEKFFELRGEILEFLKLNETQDCNIFVTYLSDNDFLIRLAFLIDICNMINEFNLLLQGKNKHIFELFPLITNFKRKLKILNEKLTHKDIKSLPKTESLNLPVSDFLFQEFVTSTETILSNMSKRFEDFSKILPIIDLHNNTYASDAQNLSPAIQKEIKEILEDLTLPLATGKEFWKHICRKKYPNSTTEIYKLYSMFGSTYISANAFSILNTIKNKSRNTLTDTNLEDLMRIRLNTTEINIDEILRTVES